jgi:uncharacterized protein YdaU (DUF1376 family)
MSAPSKPIEKMDIDELFAIIDAHREEGGAKMHYIKLHVGDFLKSVRGMSMNQIGFYIVALLNMYDEGGDIADDNDRAGAIRIGCDIRLYKRMKAELIAEKRIVVRPNGRLTNYRTAREMVKFFQDAKRRSDVAAEREASKVATQQQPNSKAVANQHLSEKPNKNKGTKPDDWSNLKPRAIEEGKKESQSQPTEAQQLAAALRKPKVFSKEEINHLEERILSACNGSLASEAIAPGLRSMSTPLNWIECGADLERDIVPALTRMAHSKKGGKISSWDYFSRGVADERDKRLAGLPPTPLTRQDGIDERRKAEEIRKMKAIVGDRPLITGFRDE